LNLKKVATICRFCKKPMCITHLLLTCTQCEAKTGTRQLAGFQQQPAAFQQRPAAFQQQPDAFQQQPDAFQQQPDAFQQQPDAFQQQPDAFQQQPPAFQQQPDAIQQSPVLQELLSSPQLLEKLRQALAAAPPHQRQAGFTFTPTNPCRGGGYQPYTRF
jgi:hypothetical protein